MGKLKINTPDGVYEKNVGETAAAEAIGELKDVVAQIYQAVSKGSGGGGIRYIDEVDMSKVTIPFPINISRKSVGHLGNDRTQTFGKTISTGSNWSYTVTTATSIYKISGAAELRSVSLPNAIVVTIPQIINNASKCKIEYDGTPDIKLHYYVRYAHLFEMEITDEYIGSPFQVSGDYFHHSVLTIAEFEKVLASSNSLVFWLNSTGDINGTFAKTISYTATSTMPSNGSYSAFTGFASNGIYDYMTQTYTYYGTPSSIALGFKRVSITEYM